MGFRDINGGFREVPGDIRGLQRLPEVVSAISEVFQPVSGAFKGYQELLGYFKPARLKTLQGISGRLPGVSVGFRGFHENRSGFQGDSVEVRRRLRRVSGGFQNVFSEGLFNELQ